MAASILVVDDEPNVRASLSAALSDEGYAVQVAGSGELAFAMLQRQSYDLVLLDVWLPGMDGLEVLEQLQHLYPGKATVMISGHANIETAVRATKLGAYDFIEKPVSLERLLLVVGNALRQHSLVQENTRLRAELSEQVEIIGESEGIIALRQQVDRAAPSNGRVLIFGENGTGKELVARRIHALSRRSQAQFVEVNCAAIPEELIESELFGHVKGSFTGAVGDKAGKFELADDGTLFLDEIGDMSLNTQAKVLRVLEEQRFERVGSNDTREVDVRVIAATNKDLRQEIEADRFREDLYYRLNVIPFSVPPLRHRATDILLLADRFLRLFSAEYGQQTKILAPEAVALLTEHSWPGNVRELRNVCERLVIMAPNETIGPDEIAPTIGAERSPEPVDVDGLSLREARELFEQRLILAKLREYGGSVRKAAEALDVERSNLYRKLKAYGIDAGELSAGTEG